MRAGFAAALALFGMSLALPARAPDADIVGLWVFQTEFPVGPEGELALTRRGDVWRGAIGGLEAEGRVRDGAVRIDFPNGGGVFRGVIDARGVLERGYWARREMTEELKRLLECVGRLEPDRQKLVLLAYYNGWSREQLAAKFETPVNTVKTWLRRSMMDIRECLGLG